MIKFWTLRSTQSIKEERMHQDCFWKWDFFFVRVYIDRTAIEEFSENDGNARELFQFLLKRIGLSLIR